MKLLRSDLQVCATIYKYVLGFLYPTMTITSPIKHIELIYLELSIAENDWWNAPEKKEIRFLCSEKDGVLCLCLV